MTFYSTQTDRDWNAQHMINESLRHERLEREAMLVDPQEATPAGERTPPMTMARLREAKVQQQAQAFRDIWTDDKDEPLII